MCLFVATHWKYHIARRDILLRPNLAGVKITKKPRSPFEKRSLLPPVDLI
jgi:hypothetical protein